MFYLKMLNTSYLIRHETQGTAEIQFRDSLFDAVRVSPFRLKFAHYQAPGSRIATLLSCTLQFCLEGQSISR
jgi:hypothetical protein